MPPNGQPEILTALTPGKRIDLWLHEKFPEQSRSNLQRLIKDNQILIDGKTCTPKSPVNIGNQIQVHFPPPKESGLTAENIPLDVLYEDRHLLVINKPAGMVVHPGAGNTDHTLVQALLYHCKGKLSGIGGVERPGIVHRLDKDTTGCLVIAKSDKAHQNLAQAFQDHLIEKIYQAVVWGKPRMLSGVIQKPIGRNPQHRRKMAVTENGREAVTHWKILKASTSFSLLECRLETGRTHQIRVHLSSIGHPIVGDTVYGKVSSPSSPIKADRQLLHAFRLAFDHPLLSKRVECEAPIPEDMETWIKRIS